MTTTEPASGPDLRRLNRKTIRLFYLLSPVVSLLLSLVIFRARGTGFAAAFRSPHSLSFQMAAGTLAGLLAALLVGRVILRSPRLASLRTLIRRIFEAAKPTSADLMLTSLSAGFSEELLFRGAIQPLLGIWLTSLLFALAHGAGVKFTRGNLLFGLFVFSTGVFLGYLFIEFGLLSAMIAHALLDLLLLFQYRSLLKAI
jgi:membrane protease YdiL (CAAX protease family)